MGLKTASEDTTIITVDEPLLRTQCLLGEGQSTMEEPRTAKRPTHHLQDPFGILERRHCTLSTFTSQDCITIGRIVVDSMSSRWAISVSPTGPPPNSIVQLEEAIGCLALRRSGGVNFFASSLVIRLMKSTARMRGRQGFCSAERLVGTLQAHVSQ